MFETIRHLLRLLAILRVLARHRALFPLRLLRVPPALIRLGDRLAGRRSYAEARPGERLAAALTELGPGFIKLGQALSVRPDLVGETMAADLGRLRDRLPPFSAAAARATVEAELGRPIGGLFASFDDRPVAAASMAQVHFAETPEGERLAVKILRPGVEAAFLRDLALLRWLATLAVRRRPGQFSRFRPLQVVETLAETVAVELDLRMEAAAASELADNFRDDATLLVPRIDWTRTGRRVLTLQRIEGISIDDRAALAAAGHDLPALACRVIQTFLKQALRDGFFHADMHQGNLFVSPAGDLIAIDFGIMGRIDRPTRLFMAELLHAFLTGDWRRAAEVHFAAGYVPADRSLDSFAQACRSIGEPILGRPVNEISIARLLAQLFQVTETFAMPAQPQLVLLQKTMVVTEGVARSLDPGVNFWEAARPVVDAWAEDNLGPEARLRDALLSMERLGRRLPAWGEGLERASRALADGGVVLQPDSLRLLSAELARGRRPLTVAAWLVVALLAVLLLRLG